jgi:hypothetical protein
MGELGVMLMLVGALLLALGISVLATRIGGSPKTVQTAKTVVEAARPPATADVRLRIDPDEAYRLREAALRTPFRGSGAVLTKPKPPRAVLPRAPPRRSPVGRKFLLEYSDEDGAITERTIRVVAVRAWQNVVYVTADCSLRRAQRTFRPDRMLQLIDSRTREQIYDPERFFAPWCDNG